MSNSISEARIEYNLPTPLLLQLLLLNSRFLSDKPENGASSAMPSESTKYRGYCHCGGFRFELTVPEIKSATACDCRLCKKKGYIWTVPPKGSYKIVRDDGLLQTYESASLRHQVTTTQHSAPSAQSVDQARQFCGRCSTGISGEHVAGPTNGQMAINLLAVREVNPFQLEYALPPICMITETIVTGET